MRHYHCTLYSNRKGYRERVPSHQRTATVPVESDRGGLAAQTAFAGYVTGTVDRRPRADERWRWFTLFIFTPERSARHRYGTMRSPELAWFRLVFSSQSTRNVRNRPCTMEDGQKGFGDRTERVKHNHGGVTLASVRSTIVFISHRARSCQLCRTLRTPARSYHANADTEPRWVW
uniref:Uncharacterized protein n=1 Tax=Anopheles coluzzii TaxID=1518534 RepID=A0A8W7PLH5_ANOCL